MNPVKTKDRFFNRLAFAVGSTFVIWFFSEMFFFNEGEGFYAFSSFSGLTDFLIFSFDLITGVLLFYGLFTLWLLMPMSLFRVRSIWALFLAGVLCGWAIEGILPIMYYEMPQALLWPAASWHVLINVFLGWFVLRKQLEKNKHVMTFFIFAALGLWWGFWGTWFWPIEGGGAAANLNLPLSIGEFAFFTFSSTTLLMLGYFLMDRFGGVNFKPTKWEIRAWIGISALGLIFLAQWYAIIFVGLSGFVMLILSRNRKFESRDSLISTFNPGIRFSNLVLVQAMPITANLIYPFSLSTGISANKYVGIILFPIIAASSVMFILSIFQILRMRGSPENLNDK